MTNQEYDRNQYMANVQNMTLKALFAEVIGWAGMTDRTPFAEWAYYFTQQSMLSRIDNLEATSKEIKSLLFAIGENLGYLRIK